MDVSPSWWRNHRHNSIKINDYVSEKFIQDFYPRTILQKRKKVDMDNPHDPIGQDIISKIRKGEFLVEFKPEEEKRRINYVIRNGKVSIYPKNKKENAKLCVFVKADSTVE